jgi:hypothetical protein
LPPGIERYQRIEERLRLGILNIARVLDNDINEARPQLRDRTRSIKLKVLAIARASRNKSESGKQKLQQAYAALVAAASRVVGQARQFSREMGSGSKRGRKNCWAKPNVNWMK